MIRINLLPVKEERKKVAVRNHLIIFAISLLVLFVIMFFMQKNVVHRKDQLQKQIIKVEAQIKELKKITKKIKPTKSKKAELEDKLKVIATLEKNRLFPVIVLDKLSNSVPNQLWFTKLLYVRDQITIYGRALDHRLVAEFAKNLEKSKYFTNIQIMGTRMKTQGPWNIVVFQIKAKVLTGTNPTG